MNNGFQMKLRVKYSKLAHQREFDDDVTTRFLHLSGGYGSGKSYSLCMKALKFRWLNRWSSGGIVAPTYPELKKDVIELMTEEILEPNKIPYKYNKSYKIFTFPWCKGKLFCFTAEKKIRGPNLSDIGLNEVTLMKKKNYMDAVGRVRHKRALYPQVYSSGTPEGYGNFIYNIFIEKPMANSRIIYGRTLDNKANLDEEYVKSLEDSYDHVTKQAYLRGEWVNMNGNQFYFSYDREKNEDRTIKRDHSKLILAAMDFNVEHMTCTLWHYYAEGIRGFDEIYIPKNADTKKMGEALIARGYTPNITTIYPDPSGKNKSTKGTSDHQILREMGFMVQANLSAPRFRERQLNMNNKLEKGWIKFNPDTMPKLRKDFLAVEQDPATLEKEKDNEELTHASDGVDYMVDVLSPFKRPSRTESVKIR